MLIMLTVVVSEESSVSDLKQKKQNIGMNVHVACCHPCLDMLHRSKPVHWRYSNKKYFGYEYLHLNVFSPETPAQSATIVGMCYLREKIN